MYFVIEFLMLSFEYLYTWDIKALLAVHLQMFSSRVAYKVGGS